MNEEQVRTESQNPPENQRKSIGDQKSQNGNPKKKKASWFRTILWMLSMMMLVNVAIGIIAYFLFFYKK